MGYAALMVHAEPSDAAEARIRLAADLADRFDAALIGFASGAVMPPPITAPVFGPAVAVEVIEAEQQRVEAGLRAAHERFRAVAEKEGRRTGWRAFLDHPADALAREARAADLLVLGRHREGLRQEPHWAVDAGDVLMRAGRPVLVVPPGVSALEGRRVLVAWKDTREARRAVADALPLLVRAEEVLVIEVVSGDADERRAGAAARGRRGGPAGAPRRDRPGRQRRAARTGRGGRAAARGRAPRRRPGRRRRVRARAAARMGLRRRHARPAGALPEVLPAEPLTARCR